MSAKILVVDDDNDTRGMMRAALMDSGYDVTTVGTLQAALDAVTGELPDLLITNIRLDGYNGLQLLATRVTPIPAIVITGFRDQVLEAEARQMGADFFVKPFSLSELLAAVNDKLASVKRVPVPSASRRWARKSLTTPLAAVVENVPARILDVCHGGLCFEIDLASGRSLPASFNLDLPAAHLSVEVDVVWMNRRGESQWLCGAAVSENRRMWREVVNALP